jgi:hypothetical protein
MKDQKELSLIGDSNNNNIKTGWNELLTYKQTTSGCEPHIADEFFVDALCHLHQENTKIGLTTVQWHGYEHILVHD